jgi:hypothetical protein
VEILFSKKSANYYYYFRYMQSKGTDWLQLRTIERLSDSEPNQAPPNWDLFHSMINSQPPVRPCRAWSTLNVFSILIHNGIIVDQVNAELFCEKIFVRSFCGITILNNSTFFAKKSQICLKHICGYPTKNSETFFP